MPFKASHITLVMAVLIWAAMLSSARAQMDYMEPVQVTPTQLMRDYKRNFHEADAQYTGKLLILTGRVKAIAPPVHTYNRQDYPYITMEAGPNQPVVVYFWEWEAEKMVGARPGATFSVMGFCQGVLPQMSIIGACVYPSGCGGPIPNFRGPYFRLPPSN